MNRWIPSSQWNCSGIYIAIARATFGQVAVGWGSSVTIVIQLYNISISNTIPRITSYNVCYTKLLRTGSVDPDTKLEIAEYNQTSISKVKAFRLQGVFYKPGWGDTVATLTMEFTLEGISFYKQHSFRENEYFHSKAILSKATRDEMQRNNFV